MCLWWRSFPPPSIDMTESGAAFGVCAAVACAGGGIGERPSAALPNILFFSNSTAIYGKPSQVKATRAYATE